MQKNLMQRKLRNVESINKPFESNIRQRLDNEAFIRFIHTCKMELKQQNQTICYSMEQVNNLINYYGDTNLTYKTKVFQGMEYYLVVPKRYVVVIENDKEKRYPITARIKGEVLRYEKEV